MREDATTNERSRPVVLLLVSEICPPGDPTRRMDTDLPMIADSGAGTEAPFSGQGLWHVAVFGVRGLSAGCAVAPGLAQALSLVLAGMLFRWCYALAHGIIVGR